MTATTNTKRTQKVTHMYPTQVIVTQMRGLLGSMYAMVAGSIGAVLVSMYTGTSFPWPAFVMFMVFCLIAGIYRTAIMVCLFIVAIRTEDGHYPPHVEARSDHE